jgi:hypothetical protein
MDNEELIMNFADGINKKQMVMVRFINRDGQVLMRKCAPLDCGISKRAKKPRFKFHFWNFDSRHILSLDIEQIIEIFMIEENFKPEDFITWNTADSPWFIVRNWGKYS